MMNYLQKKKKAMLNYVSGGRLPSEYQEVEWIQSHTFEYINTTFVPNIDSQIEIGVQLTSESGTYGDHTIFYIASDTSFDKGYKLDQTSPTSKLRATFGQGGFTTTNYYIDSSKQFDIVLNKDYVEVDGATTVLRNNALTVTNPLLLFATNRNGTIYTGYGRFILYYCKLYDNGTLARDLVPCYRKADNEIGMYDLVNDTFYTNAGSGTFTKGNDV